MIKYYVIIILIIACEGNIRIKLKASNYSNTTIIKHDGSDIKRVTDKEIQLFNITNDNLNRGVKVEMGKKPDEVFLKDPTAYGEVFKKYNWPDVRRKLSVRNIKIVEFIKQDVVLKRNDHINYCTANITSKIDIVEPVMHSITATFDKKGLPDDDIKFNVEIDFGFGKINHEAVWRDNTTTTFNMVIIKSTGVIDIKSGQTIVTELLAEKVILLTQVEMDAHLVGNIVANYAQTYGSYHLWSPTIGNIMKAAELTNEVTTKLLIEFKYFANARLKVVVKDTGEEIVLEEEKVQAKHIMRKFNKNN